MLIIPTRKEEFNKLKNGEQVKIIRECKKYWTTRIEKSNILDKPQKILIRNGYEWNNKSLLCIATATKYEDCYCIEIQKIIAENVNSYDNPELFNEEGVNLGIRD